MTGAKFKAARGKLRVSQRALAAALEVAPRTLYRWEMDQWPVPRDVSILVRAALKHAWIRHELLHVQKTDSKSAPAAP